MKRLIEKDDSGERYNEDGMILAQNLARNLFAAANRYRNYDPVDFLRILKGEVLCMGLERLTAADFKRYNEEEEWTL